MKAKCPDCDATFDVADDFRIGEVTTCPCCGLELEIKDISVTIVDNTITKTAVVAELTIEGEDWGE